MLFTKHASEVFVVKLGRKDVDLSTFKTTLNIEYKIIFVSEYVVRIALLLPPIKFLSSNSLSPIFFSFVIFFVESHQDSRRVQIHE